MQVARTCFVKKSSALSSAVKKTSCSRGWLRIVVQSIFAVITTASFILIVMMAVRGPNPSPTRPPLPPKLPTCIVNSCRVTCNDAPYYGQHEEDIEIAVTNAEAKCNRVTLELHNPSFENNTLPSNWLSRIRSNLYQLSIIDGNLNFISPMAFISQFTRPIKVLQLQNLQLNTWVTNSLVGLSSLEMLNILNCEIGCFQADSIRAVDDTLQTLTITESRYWNPKNVTGSTGFEKMTIVDFSNNEFSNILSKDSFLGLEKCKILYLNSCGIVSIGSGTFDSLTNIEVIYLNYNLLVSVPPGLFDNILVLNNPRPRVSLQENFWHCDCDMHDLRQLVRKDILLVEAICTYPSSMTGKTFTELENFCANRTQDEMLDEKLLYNTSLYAPNNNKVYVNGQCRMNINKDSDSTNKSFKLVSPQVNNRCSLNTTKNINISALITPHANIENISNMFWLKYSFVIKTTKLSAIHIGAAETDDFGLLWFQSDCPYEMYCMDTMPKFLRLYNIDEKSQFTFCPLQLSTGDIAAEGCIGYTIAEFEKHFDYTVLNWLIWCITVLLCICFGAIVVYGLIRMNPILLKGSKRILFVKHKTVDVLVLPPKVPLRNDLIIDAPFDSKEKEIFTLFSNDNRNLRKIGTIKSVSSNKSSCPSYISALQPSEDQLAEWRISHHFNNDLTISSKSELSTLSWICDDTYYSLDESDRTYESLK